LKTLMNSKAWWMKCANNAPHTSCSIESANQHNF
jgi:hypothetical protein